MKDFFISYNKADRQWAEWIGWVLEEADYSTVIEAWDFQAGGYFALEIDRATKEAQRTLAVLSPDYLEAHYTHPEWAAAFAHYPKGEKRTLIPVRIRECDLSGLLSQIITIDLVGLDEVSAREHLLQSVSGERGKPGEPPTFPGTAARSILEPPHFPGGRMATAKVARTKVFISYSHKDTKWLERLQVHLKPLERHGIVERWDDTQIVPGKKWQKEIRNALASAKIAVLLISADFLVSDFIAEDELPPLLAAAEQDGAVILPVIISPSRFTKTPSLSQFQAVNPPDKPLIKLPKAQQEEVLVQVTVAIENALFPLAAETARLVPEAKPADIFEYSLRAASGSQPLNEAKLIIVALLNKYGFCPSRPQTE